MGIKSIRKRIFTYNLALILLLMALTAVIFNLAVGRYFERSIATQMEGIAERTEALALNRGPEFFPPVPEFPLAGEGMFMHPGPPEQDVSSFYFMLEQSLREPLSVLDARYLLLGTDGLVIAGAQDPFGGITPALEARFAELAASKEVSGAPLRLTVEGGRYIAVIRSVAGKNTFGLGWVILYSSLERVERIRQAVNVILVAILGFSALVTMLFSSHMAQLVCRPFAQLNGHLQVLEERRFGQRLTASVDEELEGLVETINRLSEKLERHDQAQKTFLQNASHEFRTPLMTIQAHAEGIRHRVVAPGAAADIIETEVRRLTRMVENLLYLSRLDALEEPYGMQPVEIGSLAASCVERLQSVAEKAGVRLRLLAPAQTLRVCGDEEKLSRALENLLGNGLRHARTEAVLSIEASDASVTLIVADDGPGIDAEVLPHLFERFYKGKSGGFGLGLAIVSAVAHRHGGTVEALNAEGGAVFRLGLKLMKQGEDHA